jgi:hypothetical protein
MDVINRLIWKWFFELTERSINDVVSGLSAWCWECADSRLEVRNNVTAHAETPTEASWPPLRGVIRA